MKLFKGNIDLKGIYTLKAKENTLFVYQNNKLVYAENKQGVWVHNKYNKDGDKIGRQSNIQNYTDSQALKDHSN